MQAVTDQLQCTNLVGEGIVQSLQLIPVACKLRIRIVAHHFHDVRLVFPVIFKCCLGMLFGSLRFEVMPMREWWPVYIPPSQCPVYALFAGARPSACHLSKNWLCECDTGCSCGRKKEAPAVHRELFQEPDKQRSCLSKTSKYRSIRELYFFHNFLLRCSLLSWTGQRSERWGCTLLSADQALWGALRTQRVEEVMIRELYYRVFAL